MRPERRLTGLVAAALAAALVLTLDAASADAHDAPGPDATATAAGPPDTGRPEPDATSGALAGDGGPAPAEAEQPPADPAAEVIAAIEAAVPGTLSAFALFDRRTGETWSGGVAQTLYTASVVKLLIALDVLRGNEWRLPDEKTQAAVARMLSASDDLIASRLWDQQGRSGVVTRMSAELGLGDTTVPADEGEWELTRMSARDVVAVYRFVLDRLGASEQSFLMDALHNATPRGSDGFRQRFGIPDGLPGVDRAVKQGWMYTSRSLVLNTTGVVGDQGRYIVALLTAQPPDTTYDAGRSAVTAGIAALGPSLAGAATAG